MKPLFAVAASLCGAALAVIAVIALLAGFYASLNGAELSTGVSRVAAGASTVVAITLALVMGILLPAYAAARLGVPYRASRIIAKRTTGRWYGCVLRRGGRRA